MLNIFLKNVSTRAGKPGAWGGMGQGGWHREEMDRLGLGGGGFDSSSACQIHPPLLGLICCLHRQLWTCTSSAIACVYPIGLSPLLGLSLE